MALTKIAHSGPGTGTCNFPASGINARDMFALWVDYEGPASNNDVISGSLWPIKITFPSGGGIHKSLYLREANGSESGSVGTVTASGSTLILVSLIQVRADTGVVRVVDFASGIDSTSGTGYSASTGAVRTVAGQMVMYGLGLADTSTRSARTLTQTGATLSAITAYFGTGTGMTQEVGHVLVTAGQSTATAFVNSYTLGTASTGITGILLLAEGLLAASVLPVTPYSLAIGTDNPLRILNPPSVSNRLVNVKKFQPGAVLLNHPVTRAGRVATPASRIGTIKVFTPVQVKKIPTQRPGDGWGVQG